MQDFITTGMEVVDIPTDDWLGWGGRGWCTRAKGIIGWVRMFSRGRQWGKNSHMRSLHNRQQASEQVVEQGLKAR